MWVASSNSVDLPNIGIVDIDSEHEQIAVMLTNIHGALVNQASEETIGTALRGLATFLRLDFQDEERLMLVEKFEGYTNHREMHQASLHLAQQIEQGLPERKPGDTLALVVELRSKLRAHIWHQDVELARWHRLHIMVGAELQANLPMPYDLR